MLDIQRTLAQKIQIPDTNSDGCGGALFVLLKNSALHSEMPFAPLKSLHRMTSRRHTISHRPPPLDKKYLAQASHTT
jgi:hypothetical protein